MWIGLRILTVVDCILKSITEINKSVEATDIRMYLGRKEWDEKRTGIKNPNGWTCLQERRSEDCRVIHGWKEKSRYGSKVDGPIDALDGQVSQSRQ